MFQFKFAHNPITRRDAQEGYEDRLKQNVPLLEKALDLRRRIAAMLGYDTWADYVTEVKMVKSGKNAENVSDEQIFDYPCRTNIYAPQFLDNLEAKLRPVGEKERDILLQLKKEEHEKRGLPFDGEFYLWDYR